MARVQPGYEMDLFHGLDLLNEERGKLEFAIALLDGILIRSEDIHDLIVVDQDEFSFVCKKFRKLLAVRFQFPV